MIKRLFFSLILIFPLLLSDMLMVTEEMGCQVEYKFCTSFTISVLVIYILIYQSYMHLAHIFLEQFFSPEIFLFFIIFNLLLFIFN